MVGAGDSKLRMRSLKHSIGVSRGFAIGWPNRESLDFGCLGSVAAKAKGPLNRSVVFFGWFHRDQEIGKAVVR